MEPQKFSFAMFRKFSKYYKPYIAIILIDLFCASVTTACELVFPMIVRFITNQALSSVETLLLSTILKLGGVYLFLRIVDTVANYYMAYTGHVMGTRLETDMRRDLFAHLERLPFSFYDNAKVGQIMSRMTNDLFDITEFSHHCPEEFFIAIIKITGSFILLARINLLLTVLIFILIPFMVACSLSFRGKMKLAFKKSREQVGELNASLEDSLLGIRVAKSFANERIEEAKFNEGNQKFLSIKTMAYKYMALFQSSTRLFEGVMYVAILVLGSVFMLHGKINAADLIAYLLYIQMLLASVRRIVEFTEQFQRGVTGIERFEEIMCEPVTIKNKKNAKTLKNAKGKIEYRDVTFGYSGKPENVLNCINLHIKPGENIALVGPSGAGKTTLCNLLPRFYDIDAGAILVDGTDIRDLTLESLRSHIGVVQQDVYLFSGTVYDNIIYGKPNASMEEVEEAAKKAGAHEFIMELPNGYDTYVGERGVKLSGGQKQRISIARVFLKNPPILILDEATSSLDNESELVVQRSLEELAKKRTTLTIAHRLTTIRNAERILVLTEDGIVESGNHQELLQKNGIYAGLYQLYTSQA